LFLFAGLEEWFDLEWKVEEDLDASKEADG
jgi:hypothetical protein